MLAWLPAHKKCGREVGSGVARFPEQELFGPMKLSGRAIYDDGQMINSNIINHFTKEPHTHSQTESYQTHILTRIMNMATSGCTSATL